MPAGSAPRHSLRWLIQIKTRDRQVSQSNIHRWGKLNSNLQGEFAMTTGKENSAQEVNLEAAAKLIAALEQDLNKVSGDSRDIQRLRDEVETLKNVLNSPVRRHHWVKEGLHSIREVFENALDTAVARSLKGSQYIAEIGRILGM
jgi:hypothetical protein